MAAGKILVASEAGLFVFKLVGDVRKTASVPYQQTAALNAYAARLFQRENLDQVVIDLAELTGIDSLHLGLLAQIGVSARQRLNRTATVISTNEVVTRQLRDMALDRLFRIIEKPHDLPAALQELPDMSVSEQQALKMTLEAHKALADLSDKNRETFRNVIELLEAQHADPPPKDG